MRIAGDAHDLAQMPSSFDKTARGYIVVRHARLAGRAARPERAAHRGAQNGRRQDEAPARHQPGQRPARKERLHDPDEHLLPSRARSRSTIILQAVLMLLGALGFLSLFLSAFLIVNTISALVAPANPPDRHYEGGRRARQPDRRHVPGAGPDLWRDGAGPGRAAGHRWAPSASAACWPVCSTST